MISFTELSCLRGTSPLFASVVVLLRSSEVLFTKQNPFLIERACRSYIITILGENFKNEIGSFFLFDRQKCLLTNYVSHIDLLRNYRD